MPTPAPRPPELTIRRGRAPGLAGVHHRAGDGGPGSDDRGDQTVHTRRTDRSGYIDVTWATARARAGTRRSSIDAGVAPARASVSVIGTAVDLRHDQRHRRHGHLHRAAPPDDRRLEHLRAAREARHSVPGMATMYRELLESTRGRPSSTCPTGAWNTAPTLTRFLRHGYPRGPLLLTDWGPTNSGWFRCGQEHKHACLHRLAREFPDVRWLLIGDDGQHDPKIYPDFAAASRAGRRIAIRELTPTEQVLSHGIPVSNEEFAPRRATAGADLRASDGYGLLRLLRAARAADLGCRGAAPHAGRASVRHCPLARGAAGLPGPRPDPTEPSRHRAWARMSGVPELPEVEALARLPARARRRPGRRPGRPRLDQRAQDLRPAAARRWPACTVDRGRAPRQVPRPRRRRPAPGLPPGAGRLAALVRRAAGRRRCARARARSRCGCTLDDGSASTSPRPAPRSGSRSTSCATRRTCPASPRSAPTRSPTASTRARSPGCSPAGAPQVKGLLRDQSVLAGVGNAYSDEVLHVAQLSPFALAATLDRRAGRPAVRRAARGADGTPSRVASGKPARSSRTPSGPAMRVHGRAGQAVPRVRRHRARGVVRRLGAAVLPDLPDRRQAAGRPADVAAAQVAAAAVAGRRPDGRIGA